MQNKPPKPSNWVPDYIWIEGLAKQISGSSVVCKFGDKILLVKANYKEYWTFPGGVVDAGETPLQASARELKEEAGLTVSLDKLKFSQVMVSDKLHLKVYSFVFEAEFDETSLDQIKLQAEEIEAYQLLTKEQILSGEHGMMGFSVINWAKGQSGYQEYNQE